MTTRRRLSREDIAVFPNSFCTNTVSVAGTVSGSVVTEVARSFRAGISNDLPEQYSDKAAAVTEKGAESQLKGLKKKIIRQVPHAVTPAGNAAGISSAA